MPHLRQPRKVGLILSGTLSALGLVGLLSDPIPLRRVGLLLLSTGAMSTVTTLVSSHYGNMELQDLMEEEQQKFQSSISAAKQELEIAYEERDNIRAKLDQTIADNSATQSRLTAQTEAAISINQQLQLDIVSLNQQLQAKRTNLQELVTAFTERMRGHLEQHIATSLVQLREDVLQKSDRVPKDSPVADALLKLASTIAEKIKIYRAIVEGVTPDHANPLNDIDEFAGIFCQLQQESAALKVRYRNSLNIEERLKLKNCVDRQYAVDQLEKLAKEQDTFRLTEQECAAEIESLLNSIDILRAQLGGLEGERDRLQAEVSRLLAPKRFRRNTERDILGNKILDFYRGRELLLEGEDWEESFGWVDFYLYPLGRTKVSEIKACAEDLQSRLGFLSTPKIEAVSGFIKVSVHVGETVKADKLTDISEPPLSRLEKAVSAAIHLRIVAPTGFGKSVLLGNLVNYLTQTYTSEYELYDPKVTAREVWGNLEPTYYGAECLAPLFRLTDICLSRINRVIESRRKNVPDPIFNPQFHIIDELEFLYGLSEVSDAKEYNAKHFKINLKTILKVGREHKIKLLSVTQSPLPSDLNLRKNDLYNTASIFLGPAIVDALKEDSPLLEEVDASKRRMLRAQYKARLEAGKQWTFLFYDPQQPTEAWLGSCPPPGQYAGNNSHSENPGFDRVAACPSDGGKVPQTIAPQERSASHAEREVSHDASLSPQSAPVAALPRQMSQSTLESLLKQGTYCPNCGQHTNSYKDRTLNGKGNVRARCVNKECSTNTFAWHVQ